jgi:hypothetical protein
MHEADIVRQLHRYGEAVERHALDAAPVVLASPPLAPVRELRPVRLRRSLALSVAVAAACLLLLAVLTARLTGGSAELPGSTGVRADQPATGSTAPAEVELGLPRIAGTVTWLGSPDPRATLRVSACRSDDTSEGCTSGVEEAVVDPDGSYRLYLPYEGTGTSWDVVAHVATDAPACVFRCPWRGIQAGRAVTLTAPRDDPAPVDLVVTARIVAVRVLDPGGSPFRSGTATESAVMVRHLACGDACEGNLVMQVAHAGADGTALVVVDPADDYELTAYAIGTGWPDPWLDGRGQPFHFSEGFRSAGRLIPESLELTVRPGG